ncbi:uncharacterized protein LOC121283083 [Carcharodon carcharias]|uniref:uncharacterized protein LOC121283083 n=1 Tax=Carcharodon carcharias TaxID=13397 RepID=UPI001B7F3110|nr:uncharacterized protein LOC121283083 [Carcharodon carcharias]
MAAANVLEINHRQSRVWAGGSSFLVWALLTVWCGSPTETLDMTIFASPKDVLVNDDVSLECKFTGHSTVNLSLTNVGVQWIGAKNEMICEFDGHEFSPKRQGARISQLQLQKGDASLHLPNIQLDEEGRYTCIVFVTPEKVKKSSELRVSAQPVVHLSTKEITILLGSEGSVSCNVTGFYPQQHKLIWQKIPNKEPKEPRELKDDICTGALISNNDGTFSVSSRLRIEPTLDDDGNVYRCVMTHRSLPDSLSEETKLSVQELEEPSSAVGPVVASIICTLLLCALLVVVGFFYWFRLKGVPPEIECSKLSDLRHFEEASICFRVNRFRPQKINIVLSLKRKGDQHKTQIGTWRIPEDIAKNRSYLASNGNADDVQLLMNYCEADTSFEPLQPKLSKDRNGTYKLHCETKIFPDVDRDDEAELILHVHHKTLAEPAVKSITLDVKGVPPKVSNIVVPLHTHHNDLVALTCSINGFKPRPLTIIWQQIRRNNELNEIVRLDHNNRTTFASDNGKKSNCNHQISEVEYEDKSYGITSVLVIRPDILQDTGTKYICVVQHDCTHSEEQKEITLNVTAPPKVDKITHGAEKLLAGEPMTLSCQIHSFYPHNITVTWFKNGEKMIEEPEECEPTVGSDGLCYLTSSVKSTPTRADVKKKYMCRVEHKSLMEPLEVDWVLDQLVSMPKVTEVTADPVHPEVGKSVQLSCKAHSFSPKDNQISWFKGFVKTMDGVETSEVQFDKTTDSYYLWSKRTFIPTCQDHGKEFKMQILHSATSNKPVSSSHILKIMGNPSVEDIKLDPPEATYGRALALICNVTNFYPQAIGTAWLKNGNRIVEGITVEGPVMENDKSYRLTSRLQVTPTALDFDEEFSFRVEHVNLETPVTKWTVLTLKAYSPTLSPIKVDPKLPEVNEPITFSISFTNYAPAAVQVKWFKNGTSCTGVTNSLPKIADDGLFSSESSLTFIVAEKDHESLIRCAVFHLATKEIQEEKFILSLKGVKDEDVLYENIHSDEDDFPKVSQITCQPNCPKAGQPITVSCTIEGATIEESHITWFRDAYPFYDVSCIANTPLQSGTGFTTALTYIPKQEDHNRQLQVDVITEMDPISRYFKLKLS